jgi:hypothetical protein
VNEYLSNNEKPYFVFMGTNPSHGLFGSNEKFEIAFDEMIKWIGNRYQILFKGHPGDNQQFSTSLCNDRSIKMLPPRIPGEILMWAFPTLKVGGFQSSLFMSALKGQTIFIYSDSKLSLVQPLNALYEDGTLDCLLVKPQIADPKKKKAEEGHYESWTIGVSVLVTLVVCLIVFSIIWVLTRRRSNDTAKEKKASDETPPPIV